MTFFLTRKMNSVSVKENNNVFPMIFTLRIWKSIFMIGVSIALITGGRKDIRNDNINNNVSYKELLAFLFRFATPLLTKPYRKPKITPHLLNILNVIVIYHMISMILSSHVNFSIAFPPRPKTSITCNSNEISIRRNNRISFSVAILNSKLLSTRLVV